MPSAEELQTLQTSAEAAEGALTTGFVVTFVLQFLLSGVMSQLWNIFNTLQIIMAMKLLAVMTPVNVTIVNDMID